MFVLPTKLLIGTESDLIWIILQILTEYRLSAGPVEEECYWRKLRKDLWEIERDLFCANICRGVKQDL